MCAQFKPREGRGGIEGIGSFGQGSADKGVSGSQRLFWDVLIVGWMCSGHRRGHLRCSWIMWMGWIYMCVGGKCRQGRDGVLRARRNQA